MQDHLRLPLLRKQNASDDFLRWRPNTIPLFYKTITLSFEIAVVQSKHSKNLELGRMRAGTFRRG